MFGNRFSALAEDNHNNPKEETPPHEEESDFPIMAEKSKKRNEIKRKKTPRTAHATS